VAIICSWDCTYAFQNQPNHIDFDYRAHLAGFHKALNRRNINVDLVPPEADLGRYQLVLAPALYLVDDEMAEKLKRFVSDGGHLLLTARSGVKDLNNNVVDIPLPGLLAELCGVEVECYEPIPKELEVKIDLTLDGPEAESIPSRAWMWADVLTPTTAETIAVYRSEFYAGRTAATLNKYGQGQVLYLGTFGDDELHDKVVDWMAKSAGIFSALVTPDGVEVTERWRNGQKIFFVLNHTDDVQEINLPEKYRDLLNGEVFEGTLDLEPKAVWILRSMKTQQ